VGALEAEDHTRISFNNALNAHDLFAARGNYWLLIIKVIYLSADEALHVNSIFLHLIIMLLLLSRPIGPSTLALVIRYRVMRR
jgi:hypothetical protein